MYTARVKSWNSVTKILEVSNSLEHSRRRNITGQESGASYNYKISKLRIIKMITLDKILLFKKKQIKF